MALKIRILIIATISIIIASIAGIQSIEVSTNEAYAIKAESTRSILGQRVGTILDN